MTVWKALRALLSGRERKKVDRPTRSLLKRIETADFEAEVDYHMAISHYLGWARGCSRPVTTETYPERYPFHARDIPIGYKFPEEKPGKIIVRTRLPLTRDEKKAVDMAGILDLKIPVKLRKRAKGDLWEYFDQERIESPLTKYDADRGVYVVKE